MTELLKPLRAIESALVRTEPVYMGMTSVKTEVDEVRFGREVYVHRVELRVGMMTTLDGPRKVGWEQLPMTVKRAMARELYGDLYEKIIDLMPALQEVRMYAAGSGHAAAKEVLDGIEEILGMIRP